ncbi:MAG: hypothetical protein FWD52_07285 [Candidatus Bathyarchaeota archaeon]|nr:hypothetical protein [Candidatus Termiticorpusculum sp.]
MCLNVKNRDNFRCYHGKTFFISLLLVAALFSPCFTPTYSNCVSPFVSGTPDRTVNNETELKNAVNNAPSKTSTTITLNKDISLSATLTIPTNKDITLTSASTAKFFKLIGGDLDVYFAPDYWPSRGAVITVEGGAVLRLDGISVSNPENYRWVAAVSVSAAGTFILYNGEISGSGVSNSGVFTMSGGTISNCIGGGVGNSGYGTFSMSGGEISNNPSFGVVNSNIHNGVTGERASGTFSMSGGVIRNNYGGGVLNSGVFSMSGGEISNNQATWDGGNYLESGGGVANSGVFSMSGGEISNNQAVYGGGVYNWPDGNFNLSEKGIISNNNAQTGGGVYSVGTFNRRNGVIFDNTANQYSDIYPDNDDITGYVVRIVSIGVIVSVIIGGLFFYFKKEHKTITVKQKPATTTQYGNQPSSNTNKQM